MSLDDQMIQRIRRMHSAIGETVESDMTQLPATIVQNNVIFGVIQDFRGNKTREQFENTLHLLIDLIASLEYHLRRWASHNGHEPNKVTDFFHKSPPLQIVHDLWNSEKHGPPREGEGRSGCNPRLENVCRVMKLSTQAKPGSLVGMTMGPGGIPVIHGNGNAAAAITADIIAADGTLIGDADFILSRAVGDCENLMKLFGIDLAKV